MQAKNNRTPPSHAYEGTDRATEAGRLKGLANLASGRPPDSVERTLALAREALGMDVAFVSKFTEDRMEFRALEGATGSFGWREGGGVPLEGTFCKRVIDGRLPSVVPDARNDARVSGLEVTREADIGSYVGMPLRFSDGRVYGTLCCLSHSPEPQLQERDALFMGVLARLVADQIEREELEAERRRLEVRATGVGALLAALVARDGYTGAHSEAVVGHAVAVARHMGLSEEGVAEVEPVLVETAPALDAETPLVGVLAQKLAGAFRDAIADVGVVLLDGEHDVETDAVHQAKRRHACAGPDLPHGVDVLRGRHALLDDHQALAASRRPSRPRRGLRPVPAGAPRHRSRPRQQPPRLPLW
jgi:GAF domain